jgi:F0F1-type ATP synthase epsilon subunit
VAAVDIGVMKISLNGQWSTMALMGGFTKIDNDRITILVNNVERDVDIDLKEAQETFKVSKADLARGKGKRQAIEVDVAPKRDRTRLEAISASPPVSN